MSFAYYGISYPWNHTAPIIWFGPFIITYLVSTCLVVAFLEVEGSKGSYFPKMKVHSWVQSNVLVMEQQFCSISYMLSLIIVQVSDVNISSLSVTSSIFHISCYLISLCNRYYLILQKRRLGQGIGVAKSHYCLPLPLATSDVSWELGGSTGRDGCLCGEWSWSCFLIKKWVDSESAGVHWGDGKFVFCFVFVKEGREVENPRAAFPIYG